MSDRPIAILVKRFPKLSETFILNEVLGLEALGRSLHVFALEQASDTIVNGAFTRVRAPIEVLPNATISDWVCLLRRRPQCIVSGMGAALVEFRARDWRAVSQAIALAARLIRAGAGHLHAHFADRPAAIARVGAAFAGLRFSISAHAKDIYLEQPQRLARRLGAARFTVTCTGHNAQFLRMLAPQANVMRAYHGVDLDALPVEKPAPQAAGADSERGTPAREEGFRHFDRRVRNSGARGAGACL